MSAAVIKETARQILEAAPPRKLIRRAESLVLQSTTSIPLKPSAEPARIYICCILAIEEVGAQSGLAPAGTQRPPVPPQLYTRLLGQFRETLLAQPPSAERGHQSGLGSRHNTRAVRDKITLRIGKGGPTESPHGANEPSGSGLREDSPELGSSSANSTSFPTRGGSDQYDADPRILGRHDPKQHKRSSGAQSNGGASPARKASPRKRTKSAAPALDDIDDVGRALEAPAKTVNAVRHAFTLYSELVKDPWGLLYGLFVVISNRAGSELGPEDLRRLNRTMQKASPHLSIDTDEWIAWVERIITGQTWIAELSSRPEPAASLVGAPGGWGLGVEYTLVDP